MKEWGHCSVRELKIEWYDIVINFIPIDLITKIKSPAGMGMHSLPKLTEEIKNIYSPRYIFLIKISN